jgi:hypothetical protein
MLLEDESSRRADVIDSRANVLRRTVPAVVDGGRVLDLRQAAARGRHTRSGLRDNSLSLGRLLSTKRVAVVLELGKELRIVILLIPKVTPALAEHVTLLSEDGRHAVEGLGRERARDRDGPRTGKVHGLGFADVNGLER